MYNKFGRIVIYANYTENQLLSGTIEEQNSKVLDILKNSIDIHNENRNDTTYLIDYMYGDQDIKNKRKLTRTDINNKSVENWAYPMIDWKKTFLLGKPIQYAPNNDVAQEEIIKLNSYNNYEDKEWLDGEIYQDMLCCGRGFRFVNSSKISEDDESPFDLLNLDVKNTECVYSSGINNEQLLAYIQMKKQVIKQEINPETGLKEEMKINYDEYTVYTRKFALVVTNINNEWSVIKRTPLKLNEHIVTEYYSNSKRISLLELVIDILNDINKVENLDMDDIESFVNSVMVFKNAEITKATIDGIKEYGALSIKSTEAKQASVEILQSRLKSLDTQIFYLRKISALHNIASIPQAQNSGDQSNAETGKAMLIGQGFTSASIRINGEEQAFRRCDRRTLKTTLKICKNFSDSGISDLKVSDIQINFSKDLSENLLLKTEALMNLVSAKIPPEIRNQVIGLFSDPVNVTKLCKIYEDEQEKINSEIDKIKNNEQNNISNSNSDNKQQQNKVNSIVQQEKENY